MSQFNTVSIGSVVVGGFGTIYRPVSYQAHEPRKLFAKLWVVIAIIGFLVSIAPISLTGASANEFDADELAVSDDGVWRILDQNVLTTSVGTNLIQSVNFGLYDLQENELFALLKNAPLEFTPGYKENAAVLTVPRPDGGFERFAIVEAPVMHPALAVQFPNMKTYRGWGLDQPAATIRLDYTDLGFHAQVLSPDGQYYVDPYFHLQTDLYMSYYRHDLIINIENANYSEAVYSDTGELLYEDDQHDPGQQDETDDHDDQQLFPRRAEVGEIPEGNVSPGTIPLQGFAPDFGDQLRTYQTAVAATGEYTQFWGGTVNLGQAAIVTAINRVTGIYEQDVAVRMQLVPNNNLLIYTNGATDPYSNNDGGVMLTQNQTTIDSVIGDANYDLGHVFSTGGGGVALLGVIGQTGAKAQGVTGLSVPSGDPFYIDFVAHEMGHQFGANHSFNGTDWSCGGSRNAATAYEPGSGSTIMGYAGICGSDNLQHNSDAMFHSISIEEIRVEVTTGTGNSSATITNNGNTIPVVNAGGDYIIPDQTPFELTATGFDADGNGSLTYSWEEHDLGPARGVNQSDNGASPIFRTWLPATIPTRVFPRLVNVLTGSTVTGEQYPTTNWTSMNFRVVVRDNNSGGGGVASDDMSVRIVDSGTGFHVTSQSTSTSWTVLTTKTITWDVSGTDSGLINTPNVDILFAVNGIDFDIVLASGVPNDGSHDITVPNVDTMIGRVKVKGSGNVFFDINRGNITVAGPVTVTPTLVATTQGEYVSGGPIELAESDNMDFTLRRQGSDVQSRTEFRVKGLSPTTTPTSFEFTLEGAVFARSNVVQTVELFDYVTAAWELVSTSNAARSPSPDSVVTVTPTGDLSRFVEAGTRSMEARIHFQSDNPHRDSRPIRIKRFGRSASRLPVFANLIRECSAPKSRAFLFAHRGHQNYPNFGCGWKCPWP